MFISEKKTIKTVACVTARHVLMYDHVHACVPMDTVLKKHMHKSNNLLLSTGFVLFVQ